MGFNNISKNEISLKESKINADISSMSAFSHKNMSFFKKTFLSCDIIASANNFYDELREQNESVTLEETNHILSRSSLSRIGEENSINLTNLKNSQHTSSVEKGAITNDEERLEPIVQELNID